MGSIADSKWDDEDGEYSIISYKGEIGFIDYQEDKSVCNNDPTGDGLVAISFLFRMQYVKSQSVSVGEKVAAPITIRNSTDEVVELWAKIYASTTVDSFQLSVMKPPPSTRNAVANAADGWVGWASWSWVGWFSWSDVSIIFYFLG
ncbi:unnamed protein product [Linum trigynum]|uniref:Uncharacterized protein n=1 Tax=Linum trigynum TaxID=586398 RepID=A0AAV2DW94_9ROSI